MTGMLGRTDGMKKKLLIICLAGYLMPVVLGVAGSFLGCEVESILALVIVGLLLLFLDCICLVAYSRTKKLEVNGLMVLCYLGMAPFCLFLFLFVLGNAWNCQQLT